MMRYFNTLSQEVETFVPQKGLVTVYVCGITPYDTTHLGHAFTYTNADILVRYLEYQGHAVRYVQNVTDIDDDILRKGREVDEDWRSLGNRWTRHFINDMLALNIRPPDAYPRATDFISEIIEMVQNLISAGVAYESAGNVYFNPQAWPDYGKLSRLTPQEMLPIANERGNRPDDPHKRAPLDFVLWQAQAPGEPAWDSPWGPGRPGWHIECSTMSTCLLDKTIDIHMGGADLLFPHHESSIAQVEPVTHEKPFVRYWMHIAMVHHAGEKMSKSLGNLVMIRDLLKDWSADAIRLYLAMHHYRQVWSHDEAELNEAAQLEKILLAAVGAKSGAGDSLNISTSQAAFVAAMEEDLDTPLALRSLADIAKHILAAAAKGQDVEVAQSTLRSLSGIFGLRLDASGPGPIVAAGWQEHLNRFQNP
jgi:L-cysteine:1D-myo-inositol 2-amino-2-deoxy-alpha-D-glucopyranoside ligase